MANWNYCHRLIVAYAFLDLLRLGILSADTKGLYPSDERNLDDSVKLLYGESGRIGWTDLDITDKLLPLLTLPDSDIMGLDYHYHWRVLYFANASGIWSWNVSDPEDNYQERPQLLLDSSATGNATSLAVDWTTDTLYWASPNTQSVQAVNLTFQDGVLVVKRPTNTVISDTGRIGWPNNIVLDPYSRLLFLAVDGSGFLRASTDYDGNAQGKLLERVDVPREMFMRSVNLAIDIKYKRLYVTSRQDLAQRLVSCDYNGKQALYVDLSEEWWNAWYSIGVHGSQLFWLHHRPRERDTVWKGKITANGTLTGVEMEYRPPEIMNVISRVWTIKVFHSDIQRSSPEEDRKNPHS